MLLLALVVLPQCKESNPITGRKQLRLINPNTLFAQSESAYRDNLQKSKPCQDAAIVSIVKEVSERVINATLHYYKMIGRSNDLKNYRWEVYVIDEPDVINATCMPGGKIVVYTGILRVTVNPDGLASVLGHEIGHALANHSAERTSQIILAQAVAAGIDVATLNEEQEVRQAIMQLYGIGAQFGVILPFSRKHESESDQIGLRLMALAGYDPYEAPRVWKRMIALGGQQPPQFLNTHPSHEKRITDLNANIPKAIAFAKKYGGDRPFSPEIKPQEPSKVQSSLPNTPALHPEKSATVLGPNRIQPEKPMKPIVAPEKRFLEKDPQKNAQFKGGDQTEAGNEFWVCEKPIAGTTWKIQLGYSTTCSVAQSAYDNLRSLGIFEAEYLPNTKNYRILIGSWKTEQETNNAACVAKQQKFSNVIVAEYREGNRISSKLIWRSCN